LLSKITYLFIENAISVVSAVEKTDNIPNNNFSNFKHTLTTFGRQHLKSNMQLARCW